MRKQRERDIISGRLHDIKLKQIFAGLSALMSVVIALIVVFNLVQPVNTMTTICGHEEHKHSSACYTQELACAHEGEEGHSHTSECYRSVLTCGLSEHTHTEACYPKTDAEEAKADDAAEQKLASAEPAASGEQEAEPAADDSEALNASGEAEPAAPAETEASDAEPAETPTEAGETEQPADAAEEPAPVPAVKVESVLVNPGTVFPNESAAFAFVTANAEKLNYTLAKGGETIASGELPADETSYIYTPDKIGEYTFALTATGADGQQDTASTTLHVVRAEGLTVRAQADQRSVLGGKAASFTLSSEAAADEGVTCSIVVKQGESVLYEAEEFQEHVSVSTQKADAVTTITLTVTLTDAAGTTAQAEASIPCAVDKVETAAQWEKTMKGVSLTGVWADDLIAIAKTQLGYSESTENFVIDEDGKTQGWTRYGAKYGIPYDEWCAAFVSFCLDYAQVPKAEVPRDPGCQHWLQALQSEGLYKSARSDAEPQSGDLIFFDWKDEETGKRDGVADHIGIYLYTDGSGVHTLEGNHSKSVSYVTYSVGDGSILGYGLLSKAYEAHLAKQNLEYTYTGEGFTATASCTGLVRLPKTAKLVVEETALADSDSEAIAAAFADESLSALADARAFVVSFAADGYAVQAQDTVTVTVTFEDGIAIAENAAVKGFSLVGGAVQAHDVELDAADGTLKAITFAAEPYVSYGAAVLTSAEDAEADGAEAETPEENEENPEENEVGSDETGEEIVDATDAETGDDEIGDTETDETGDDETGDTETDETGEDTDTDETGDDETDETGDDETDETGDDETDETDDTDETGDDETDETTDATAMEYAAEISLADGEAPFSLLSLLTEANADAALAEDLLLDYDAALLSIEKADGDYLVTPLAAFERATLVVEADGVRYALELTDWAEAEEEIAPLSGSHSVAVHGADYDLSVYVPEGANLPAGASFVASAVTEDAEKYIAKALEAVAGDANAEDYKVLALFDLTIYDENNQVISPAEGTSLQVGVNLGDALASDTQVSVVHFPGTGEQPAAEKAEEPQTEDEPTLDTKGLKKTPMLRQTMSVNAVEAKSDELTTETLYATNENGVVLFNADSFSVYAIVGSKNVVVNYLTADGKTLTIDVTFDDREELPEDAMLDVSEVTYEENPDAYAQRNERLAAALFDEYGNVAITDVRYLNISVMIPDVTAEEGEVKWIEYEPIYPVEVKISYNEPMDTTNPGVYEDYNDGSTKVTPDIGNHIVGVHYTEDGAEFLETIDENTDAGVSKTITHTDGFSEYDFAYIYEYEIIDTNYSYTPSSAYSTALRQALFANAADGAALRGAGDTPAHTKTLSNNNDGTYTLSLTVTGDADTDNNTASNANVIIVFDTSNSMINYYVPMANGGRGSNYEDGKNSFVLYYWDWGEYRYREAYDGYTGTVYRRNGNSYTEYTGQRYSKTIRRADAAEKVLYDFVHALYGYQNADDPSTPNVDESKNIQTALITFNRTARTVQNWSSRETDITNRVSSTGAGGSKKLGNDSGTNWEGALQQAQTLIGTDDSENDPTFVVFITDGQPTQVNTTPSGTYLTDGTPYVGARDDALEVQQACAASGTESHGALFSIYAYGTEADYLDDLMYYAYNNGAVHTSNLAAAGEESFSTEGYYNAGDTAALTEAINDIFSKIVKTLGITGVSISDGTTSKVQTSSGEISHLLDVDTSSYEYWLSFRTVDNKFTMKDLVSGEDVEYTVTSSGNNVTISWAKGGTSYSANYEGTYTAGTARIKWESPTSFYNYAPPAAVFSDPSVDWNLTNVGTLLDGVTYEVTFECYPSQYTYDTIARLKNGDLQYDDLDSEVKKYLREDYSLATNTKANLTYTDSRTENGEQTVPYTNPNPVATNSDTLTIQKEWVGGDPDVDELPITVMMRGTEGNEVFHTSNLSAVNDWLTDATISIGIIKNGQALPGALGHDFSFAELDDTQYRWELDAPTVRPMLVNSVLTMLVKVDEKHPVPTGAATYTIEGATYYVDSAVSGLTATNIRRSYLDVVKTVTGTNAPADAVFDFTMKVVNSRASIAGDSSNLDSDYYVWFSVADSNNGYAFVVADDLVTGDVTREIGDDGEPTGYYYMLSGTTIHVNMKAGYSLRFLNLPSGSAYEIAESETMPDESFSFVSITGDGTVDPDNEQKMTGTIVSANKAYRVEVQNKYSTVGVKLAKVDDKNEPLNGSIFSLTKYSDTSKTWNLLEGYENIKPANIADLGNLGVGWYRFQETHAPDGYIILSKYVYLEVYKDTDGTLKAKLTDENGGTPAGNSDPASITGPDDGKYTITVKNTPGVSLPSTGANGALPYTASGLALLALALLGAAAQKRRSVRVGRPRGDR